VSIAALNGGAYWDLDSSISLTGTSDFLALHIPGNGTGTETGFNGTTTPTDVQSSTSFQLDQLTPVTMNFGGGPQSYYEFIVAVSEPGGAQSTINLTEFQLFTSSSPATTSNFSGVGSVGFTLDYNLTTAIATITDVNGSAEGAIFVPVSAFSGASPTDYVTLQAQFQNAGGGPDTFNATITSVVPTPSLSLVKSFTTTPTDSADVDGAGNGEIDHAGQLINYQVVVTNTGNETLTNVVVTDPAAVTALNPTGQIGTVASLAPGGTSTISFSVGATQTQIDAGAAISNTAHATDTQQGATVTDSNTVSTLIDQDPAMTLTKSFTTTPTDGADLDGSGNGEIDHAGQLINYQVVVTNTGNETLTNVVVTDPAAVTLANPTGLIGTVASLAPGGTSTISFSVAASQTQIDAGTAISNTAHATDTQQGATVTDSNAVSTLIDQDPAATIEKLVSVDGGKTYVDANSAPFPTLLSTGAGTPPPLFEFVITNTGNVMLTNLTLHDSTGTLDFGLGSGVDGKILSLPPGSNDTFGGGLYGVDAPIVGVWGAGLQTDTGTLTGSFTDNNGVQTNINISDTATYFGANPSVTIEKDVSVDGGHTWVDANSATGPTLLASGDAPEFRYIVANTGNVGLTINVGDNVLGPVGTGSVTLGAGGQTTLYANGTWAAGQNTNTGDASWSYTDSGGHTATGDPTDVANYFGAAPSLTFVKEVSVDGGKTWSDADTASGEPTLLKGFAAPEFRYVVTDTGNVDLANVAVTDNVLGPVKTIGSLAANGGTSTTIVNGTWAAGQNTNTGDANWSYTDSAGNQTGGDPTNDANYFGLNPALNVEKLVSVDGGTNWYFQADDADDTIANVAALTGIGAAHLHIGTPSLPAGNQVKFEFVVSNVGNVDLNNVSLTDNVYGTDANHNFGTVKAGATVTETITETSVYGAAVTDTATVTSDAVTDTAGDSLTPKDTDSAAYNGTFTQSNPGLSIGYWYNHHTGSTWDECYVTINGVATKGLLLGDALGAVWAAHQTTGTSLGSVPTGMLFIPDAAAAQLINASQTANDTRQILLSQAIAAQENIDHGTVDPGTHPYTPGMDLIGEAVAWLTSGGGNIDTNHDGILETGATNSGNEYNTTTRAFTSTALTSNSSAWQTQHTYVSADYGSFSADGEGLKNALQALNTNHLVTENNGAYVAWNPSGTPFGAIDPASVSLNGPNDFWHVLHLETSSGLLHGIL
jgi:uncharacterized repeat protein (TIGR01451 family)